MAGARPVVYPTAPSAAIVLTRIRNAGFSSKKRPITCSSREWITSECPTPP